MSAENMHYVMKIWDGDWRVKYGFTEADVTVDWFDGAPSFPSRGEALVAAHDMEHSDPTEHGVVEVESNHPVSAEI